MVALCPKVVRGYNPNAIAIIIIISFFYTFRLATICCYTRPKPKVCTIHIAANFTYLLPDLTPAFSDLSHPLSANQWAASMASLWLPYSVSATCLIQSNLGRGYFTEKVLSLLSFYLFSIFGLSEIVFWCWISYGLRGRKGNGNGFRWI